MRLPSLRAFKRHQRWLRTVWCARCQPQRTPLQSTSLRVELWCCCSSVVSRSIERIRDWKRTLTNVERLGSGVVRRPPFCDPNPWCLTRIGSALSGLRPVPATLLGTARPGFLCAGDIVDQAPTERMSIKWTKAETPSSSFRTATERPCCCQSAGHVPNPNVPDFRGL